jgi:uncharacterized membrane protein YeaQ/YmgE (transglycosylase-associated protein family)
MDLGLIIQLISGAVGGNVAGSLMKNANLGPVLNSIVGLLGGGLGGQLLAMLGVGGAEAAAGSMDIVSIVTQVLGGGVGGGVLVAIVGLIKNAMAKQ